ncbi:hypothetical protein BDU57DRAFT_582189 [Ampelomyces quisqualis]|uniref:Uncharacterized protein n=1 Tax=Ampelomyces quisqualis TaxID=50730 RepID=A0A6A5QDG6_AMPQU|nr:hypothetical protein BDU57DRAFT_582189 [Ampelomyces quisqualis]
MAAERVDDSVDATAFCTPLLAWLINAMPAEQLQTCAGLLRYLDDSFFERNIAKRNNFIALTPDVLPTAPADGIVLDNTAMQFENPPGAHTKSQYFHHYVDLTKPYYSAPLDNCFSYHCTKLKTPGCANMNVLALAIGMCLSNGIIYDRISQISGPGALFSKSHVDFLHELECIKGLLHGGLQELRNHIDHVCSTNTPPLSTLEVMVDGHAGLGYKIMMGEAAVQPFRRPSGRISRDRSMGLWQTAITIENNAYCFCLYFQKLTAAASVECVHALCTVCEVIALSARP